MYSISVDGSLSSEEDDSFGVSSLTSTIVELYLFGLRTGGGGVGGKLDGEVGDYSGRDAGGEWGDLFVTSGKRSGDCPGGEIGGEEENGKEGDFPIMKLCRSS